MVLTMKNEMNIINIVEQKSNVDEYVEKAQKMANKMMEDAFLPVCYARKAEKVPVIILENEYKREII